MKSGEPKNLVDGSWPTGRVAGVERNEAQLSGLLDEQAESCGRTQSEGIGACQGFDPFWGRSFIEIGCSLNEFLPDGINASGIGVRSGLC